MGGPADEASGRYIVLGSQIITELTGERTLDGDLMIGEIIHIYQCYLVVHCNCVTLFKRYLPSIQTHRWIPTVLDNRNVCFGDRGVG